MSRKKIEEIEEHEPKKKVEKKQTVKKTKKTETDNEKKTIKNEKKKEEKIITKTKRKAVLKSKEKMSLPEKDQKVFKTLSRIVSVIAMILKVLAMIVVPIIAIVAILVPIMFSKIEVDGNIVRFSDMRFVMGDDSITAHIGNKSYVLADNFKDMNKVIDFLNDSDIQKIMINFELFLVFTIVVIVINIYVLGYIEKLFDNFYRGKTPFTDDNTNYIRKIGVLMIISLIVSIVFEIILSLVAKNGLSEFKSSYNITAIVITYISYYIFKYAAKLQEKNGSSIYD